MTGLVAGIFVTKVFEHDAAHGPGVISFISASSYLDGNAFGGMREHLRRQCDHIWILDLGGEGRGPRKSDNVFAIQTPVAIAVAVREKDAKLGTPPQFTTLASKERARKNSLLSMALAAVRRSRGKTARMTGRLRSVRRVRVFILIGHC